MQKTNVNTELAIFFTAIMLIIGLGAAATATGPITLQKAFAQLQLQLKGSDRCVSFRFSNGGTMITCITTIDRKLTNELVNEVKNDCKEAQEEGLVDKCSGSQSGFGVFCNLLRIKQDSFAFFASDDLSCSEVRHIQKDLLGQ